jgi:uncharacterized membrane protein YfcA
MAFGLQRLGLFGLDGLIVSALGAGAALLGLGLGARLRRRLSPEGFRLALLAMLSVMGVSLLVRAF